MKKQMKILKRIFLGVVLMTHIYTGYSHAEYFPITSEFGYRFHPISGEWKFHAGVDLGYDFGTQVPVLFNGTVILSGNFGDGYGNQVLVYHDYLDSYSRYAHLNDVFVSAGDYVEQGGIIGLVGSTGYSTGPHLHLEYIVRADDGSYVYTNPLELWQ